MNDAQYNLLVSYLQDLRKRIDFVYKQLWKTTKLIEELRFGGKHE